MSLFDHAAAERVILVASPEMATAPAGGVRGKRVKGD
jgi:hypothetical protein